MEFVAEETTTMSKPRKSPRKMTTVSSSPSPKKMTTVSSSPSPKKRATVSPAAAPAPTAAPAPIPAATTTTGQPITLEMLLQRQRESSGIKQAYEEHLKRQNEIKLEDICAATSIPRVQAEIALGVCDGNEIDAINRLLASKDFAKAISEMALTVGQDENTTTSDVVARTKRKISRAARGLNPDDTDCSDSNGMRSDDEDDDLNEAGEPRKRRRRITTTTSRPRKVVAAAATTDDATSGEKPIRINGYNVDGTKRAPTISLNDALKRLEEIKSATKPVVKGKGRNATRAAGQTEQSSSASPTKKSVEAVSTKRVSPTRSPRRREPISSSSSSSAGAFEDDSPNISSTRNTKKARVETKTKSSPVGKTTSSSAAATTTTTTTTTSSHISGTVPKSDDDYTREDLEKLQWSAARIKAFLNRKTNENAYYYRFNAPGEEQARGGWTKKEHDHFMDLIKDGVDYHWGILSMKMPGRVGYQCSNYYRKLIQDGKVHDPNYNVDEAGKLIFSRGELRESTVVPKVLAEGEEPPPRVPRVGGNATSSRRNQSGGSRRKRSRRVLSEDENTDISESSESEEEEEIDTDDDDEEEEDDDENIKCDDSSESQSASRKKKKHGKKKKKTGHKKSKVLLPHMKDVLTMKLMKEPVISPYGHVLDYSTWLKLLNTEPKNTCPFTKQRLTRRMLIKLTKDNLEEHREFIIDAPEAQPEQIAVVAAATAVVGHDDDREDEMGESDLSMDVETAAV